MEQLQQEFRNRILNSASDQYTIRDAGDRIFLTSAYAEACIRFHEMNIIEFQITRKTDDQVVFYLHFQLNDESHALYLLEQLEESLIHTGPVSTTRILLSCSSALTTSFFAQKLNQTAQLLNLPFTFTAVSSDLVPDAGNAYDMILLAPQISYRKKDLSALFPEKTVLEIPPILFGTYDVQGILDLISRNLSDTGTTPRETAHIMNSSRKIMGITTRIDSQFKISWRIFHHGKIIRSETVIKNRIEYHDFEDIMDTVSVLEHDIDTVIVSIPGVVHDGTVILDRSGFREYDMKTRLSQKYPYQFIITNNANSTALGLYHLQNDYHTVIYHSQLREAERAGQGIVIDGHVITGKKGIAGEVNYLPAINSDPSLSPQERAARAIARALIADIAIVGPDAVYIRCELIHDTKRIRELIREKVDEIYIPDLIIIDHATEYMYYGAQLMASARDSHSEKAHQ